MLDLRPPRVGVSASFFHADTERLIFKGKTLLYLEQDMSNWIMSGGAIPVLVPVAEKPFSPDDLVANIDGLLLHGGDDVAPSTYGEEPLRSEWAGDFVRDAYEQELLAACMEQDKPVLGICRGTQLINVALGGTLYQDIATQRPDAQKHRDWNVYDQLRHAVRFVEGSRLHTLYGGIRGGVVNSVHHQGIKHVAESLAVEARSVPDDIVEAVRYRGDDLRYVVGLQWHPEFQRVDDIELLAPNVVLDELITEARARMV